MASLTMYSRSTGPSAALPSPPRENRRAPGALQLQIATCASCVDALHRAESRGRRRVATRIHRTGGRRTPAQSGRPPGALRCLRASRGRQAISATRHPATAVPASPRLSRMSFGSGTRAGCCLAKKRSGSSTYVLSKRMFMKPSRKVRKQRDGPRRLAPRAFVPRMSAGQFQNGISSSVSGSEASIAAGAEWLTASPLRSMVAPRPPPPPSSVMRSALTSIRACMYGTVS